ncbi:MAG: chorismate mutase [Bacteroidales bacterium]|jgi:chorismate mutase|nr:chorismate mutase [Bacteroidales bacterium]
MLIPQSDLTKALKPFIIAGPCSAESPQQLLQTAIEIKQNAACVQWFRAGVWKPRTRPSSFEGMGEQALVWLSEIKEKTGLKVCTEVVKPKHIELCLKHNIDALWIGARTSTNPILVQELANCIRDLGATNVPVMVKNPVNPDVNLWIGAMERLFNVGCEDIVAVHRGFSLMNSGKYRQSPLWSVPIELKRVMPSLSILCDPSHIAGKRDYIFEISQMAMNLSYDGLMIETHYDPETAQTDSRQQITPQQLAVLLNRLTVPSKENKTMSSVTAIREQIDRIDSEIIELLQRRMKHSEDLALIKRAENMSLYQPNRWKQLLEQHLAEAEQKGLSADFVKIIFEQIHEESIKVQSHSFQR